MKKKKLKKRAITLIEIMVVILIIGTISGVLAYNFKGSLDKGKVFKTKHGAEQIRNILLLEVANGADIAAVATGWQDIIKNSPLASKPKDLIKDGWGDLYKVSVQGEDFLVTSDKCADFEAAEAKKRSA